MALIGEAGTGKTTLLHALIDHVEADGSLVMAVTARPGMAVEDLIFEAGSEVFGDDPDAARDLDLLIERIEERLDEAGTGVLVIDDAHDLDIQTLYDLVELAGSDTDTGRFVQILLSGKPKLERKLTEPGLHEAMQQMGVVYYLPPLDAGQVDAYVRERLRLSGASNTDLFEPEAIAQIAALSRGFIGAINMLCSAALHGAAREGERRVTAGHVQAVAADLGFDPVAEEPRRPVQPPPVPPPPPAIEIAEPIPPAPSAPPARPRVVERMTAEHAAVPPHVPPRPARPERLEPDDFHHPESPLRAEPPLHREPESRRRSRFWPWAAAATVALLVGAGAGAALLPSRPLDRLLASVTGTPNPPPITQTAPVQSWPIEPDASKEPLPPVAQAQPPAVMPPAVMPAPAPEPVAPAAPPEQLAALPPADPPPERLVPDPIPPAPEPEPPAAQAPPETPAPAEPQGPDPAIEQRVAELAQRAERYISQRWLTTPVGTNAFEMVQQIRQIAPGHPKAEEIVDGISETYQILGRSAEQRGQFDTAADLYRRGLTVDPGDSALSAMLEAVEQRQAAAAAPEPTAAETPAPTPDSDQILRLPPDYYEREAAEAAAQEQPQVAENRPLPPPNSFTTRDEMIEAFQSPELLQSVIRAGRDLNYEMPDGKTPLMIAAEQGFEPAVRQLLAAGAAPNARSRNGGTALMYAASIGNNGIVRSLLQYGGAVNAMNVDGKTALMAAAARGHTDTVRMLLENGANSGITNIHGRTALSYAQEGGHDGAATLLQQSAAQPGARTSAAPQSVQTRGPVDLRFSRPRNEVGQLGE